MVCKWNHGILIYSVVHGGSRSEPVIIFWHGMPRSYDIVSLSWDSLNQRIPGKTWPKISKIWQTHIATVSLEVSFLWKGFSDVPDIQLVHPVGWILSPWQGRYRILVISNSAGEISLLPLWHVLSLLRLTVKSHVPLRRLDWGDCKQRCQHSIHEPYFAGFGHHAPGTGLLFVTESMSMLAMLKRFRKEHWMQPKAATRIVRRRVK